MLNSTNMATKDTLQGDTDSLHQLQRQAQAQGIIATAYWPITGSVCGDADTGRGVARSRRDREAL